MDFKEALKDPKKIIFSLGMKGKLGFITDEKYWNGTWVFKEMAKRVAKKKNCIKRKLRYAWLCYCRMGISINNI